MPIKAVFYKTDHTGEYYIAPLYNAIKITAGKKINFLVVPKTEMLLFGTPAEYIDFVKSVIITA